MTINNIEILHRRMVKILQQWDFLCVICGEPFISANSITREHLIPISEGGTNNQNNLAPSHHRCNSIRGTNSLIETDKLINKQRIELGNDFIHWLNRSVPNRVPSLNNKRKRKRKSKVIDNAL